MNIKKENLKITLDYKQKRYQKQIATEVIITGTGLSFVFMGLGAILVAQLALSFQGIPSFCIAFFGSLFVALSGVLMAYRIGKKNEATWTRTTK